MDVISQTNRPKFDQISDKTKYMQNQTQSSIHDHPPVFIEQPDRIDSGRHLETTPTLGNFHDHYQSDEDLGILPQQTRM